MTFERIYSHIIEKVPQLAPRTTYTIYEWIAAGYNTEKDIIPAIDFVCKKGTKQIKAFGWFTHTIQWMHEKRVKEQLKPKEPNDQERKTIRAQALAFHRKIGRYIPIYDREFLDNYEKENGVIA